MGADRFVIARFTAGRAARSGALWGAIFSASIFSTASGFTATFPTEAARVKLARSFEGNAGIAALLGPAHDISKVTSFTSWRITVILSLLGAVWGLLTGTRLLRGEEDAGRWEILLTGRTTRANAAAQALAGLAAGWLVLWAMTAAGAVAVGSSGSVGFETTSSVFFATTVCATAAVFLAVGALTSQLAATRRQANMLGAGLIGGAYLLRMAADSSAGARWLRWLSPIGWAEELRPLIGSRPIVLVLVGAATAVLGALAVALAGRRDLGASALPGGDVRTPRTALLGGATGLTARLAAPAAIAWVVSLAITGLVTGIVAQSGADAVSGSSTVEEAIARLGGYRVGAAAYLGITFLFSSLLVTVAAAGQVSAARGEEGEGHLDNLLVRPVSRTAWFAGRLAIGAGLIVAASAAVGVAAWIGAASQGTDIGFGTLVEAGANVAPPALVVLGLGALLLGVWPRRAVAITYAVVVWSFLVELIGAVTTSNQLLLDTSVLHHSVPAPAAPPDWASSAALAALAILAAAVGLAAFHRRDLAGA